MPRVQFLDLARQHAEIEDELKAAFAKVIKRGVFILGEAVEAFESEWAAFCEAKGAVGVANGTDAITLSLLASGAIRKERGDEIITSPLTAPYTALAILNAGAIPVFADINPQTYTIDPHSIESVITTRTRAIIPVHLYGQAADMETISQLAAQNNLIVIEDAAQAHGARLNDKPVGAFSKAATFSFYPTKNLGACGDGGAVISNDEDFLSRVRALRQGGHEAGLKSGIEGRNSRLDELQAEILLVKLKKLNEWTGRRIELARKYDDALRELSGFQTPFVSEKAKHVFHLYVIRHPERDALSTRLSEQGIETLIHYPRLLHQEPLFRSSTQKPLPVAERVVNEILSLPLYPQITDEEIERVINACSM